MSSAQNDASREALSSNKELASNYYSIAIPGLQKRQESINAGLFSGQENPLIQGAFEGQRAGLTEGISGQNDLARRSQLAGSKQATAGGNILASLSPSDIGSHLANALYGSKFQQGQADINQKMNLMSMALGGAGTTGNSALTAAGQNLSAIGYLPQFNSTYANIAGGLAGAASIYGGLKNGLGSGQPTQGAPPAGYGFTGQV